MTIFETPEDIQEALAIALRSIAKLQQEGNAPKSDKIDATEAVHIIEVLQSHAHVLSALPSLIEIFALAHDEAGELSESSRKLVASVNSFIEKFEKESNIGIIYGRGVK